MNIVTGAARLDAGSYAMLVSKRGGRYGSLKELHREFAGQGVFSAPIRNFARFDSRSMEVTLLAGMVLRDAGYEFLSEKMPETGIICVDGVGSHQANKEYFRDYVDSGRVLGRGNLFIYTLATSAAAEAAIACGLKGPLQYLGTAEATLRFAVAHAVSMLDGHETDAMLCVVCRNDVWQGLLLERRERESGHDECNIDAMVASFADSVV